MLLHIKLSLTKLSTHSSLQIVRFGKMFFIGGGGGLDSCTEKPSACIFPRVLLLASTVTETTSLDATSTIDLLALDQCC